MNIFRELARDLELHGTKICNDKSIWEQSSLEIPKDPLNGDISTNIAMIIASKNGGNPREVALKFKESLNNIAYIAHIEVAGPGFINFTIKADKWHECIRSILNDSADFWEVDIGKGKRVNIEYVSANPTGPMHIGHARGAVYGDALANLMSKCAFDVTKEYYVNDAGAQIDVLVESTLLRYKEAVTGQGAEIPEGLYPGEYLKDVGNKLKEKYQDTLLKDITDKDKTNIRDFVVSEMLDLIKKDLAMLGVKHDVFVHESSFYKDDKIIKSVEKLNKLGLIYNGILPPPKGKQDDNWEAKEQTLFKSTNYGDDQDRPIKKSDGSWTYLAADFAYAQDKIDRGFESLVYILGADHSGYVSRIKAVIDALSDGKVESDVRTCQLVNFVKDGSQIKMSKRKGQFMTVNDVISEVSKDIIRFIMLTRRNDMTLDFDFSKVVEQSRENPVFYVQYAHVRTMSIITKAKDTIEEAYDKFVNGEFDLSLIETEEEIQLIKLLSSWPRMLITAARKREPHRIAYFLIDVASRFHSIWNLGKENNDYKFNISENIELTAARLALAEAIRKIIAGGFELIGVTPMTKM